MCTLCRAVQRRVVESKPEERFARTDHVENFSRKPFMSRITEDAVRDVPDEAKRDQSTNKARTPRSRMVDSRAKEVHRCRTLTRILETPRKMHLV